DSFKAFIESELEKKLDLRRGGGRDVTLRVSVLASGSTGNAFYIESDKQKLLVDAGLSGKQLDRLFSETQVDPNQLSGILVTHEHRDHIKGLGIFARTYNLPIYA